MLELQLACNIVNSYADVSESIQQLKRLPMPADKARQAKLTTVALFPRHYFLENLVIRDLSVSVHDVR
jgi:hypothetical protein